MKKAIQFNLFAVPANFCDESVNAVKADFFLLNLSPIMMVMMMFYLNRFRILDSVKFAVHMNPIKRCKN
jgi:hypothetical protein